MNRVHTINCTQVVYQYCDIGMIACRFSSMCKYIYLSIKHALNRVIADGTAGVDFIDAHVLRSIESASRMLTVVANS